jgi:hypothetical protein
VDPVYGVAGKYKHPGRLNLPTFLKLEENLSTIVLKEKTEVRKYPQQF